MRILIEIAEIAEYIGLLLPGFSVAVAAHYF